VVVSAGGLYGLDPADGTIIWTRPGLYAPDGVAPMLVNNTVYLPTRGPNSNSAVLYAVRADTGAGVWPIPALLPDGFESGLTAAVYPDLGLLFLGLSPPATTSRPETEQGAVMALRLVDGTPAWVAPAALPAPPAGLSVGWVATTGALSVPQPAIFVTAGATITALQALGGAILWNRALPESRLQGAPVLSTSAIKGSILYVAGASGRVYALNSTTGADAPGGLPAGASPISGPLALAGSTLLIPTANGLVAVEATTGSRLWQSPLGAGVNGVAIAGGSVYVVTTDGQFVGFSH
jgi:outer membrane protein assembly factor BamB